MLVVGYNVFQGYFGKRKSIFGFPFIGGLMFGYFYVFQVFFVATSLSHMVRPWMLALSQFVALVCICSTFIGWRLGLKRGVITERFSLPSHAYLNLERLWWSGIFTVVIAIVSLHVFRFVNDWDFKQNSAYWYMLYHIGFPGILVALLSVHLRNNRPSTSRLLIIATLAIALTYIFILGARRGPIFPLVIVVLFGWGMYSRKKPSKFAVSTGLVLVGLLLLVFPHVRSYSDGTLEAWSDAKKLEAVTFESITVGKASTAGDNEALYHVVTISTAYEFDNYQWGTGYLSLVTHWIPRHYWPDKPKLGEGWFRWTPSLVYRLTGWFMTNGAAAGGIAETFMEIGFFCFGLWFLLGFGLARLYSSLYTASSILRPAQYIVIVSATHWLVSQGLVAAFTPTVIYIVAVTLLFKVTGSNRIKFGPSDNRLRYPVY